MKSPSVSFNYRVPDGKLATFSVKLLEGGGVLVEVDAVEPVIGAQHLEGLWTMEIKCPAKKP